MLPMLSSFAFDSNDDSSPYRLDDWRNLMSATHDVLIPHSKERRFHVDMKLWNLGQLMISAGNFSGQIFTRKFEHIRRDHIDHYLFFVQGAGQRIVQSADFELLLMPGDVALLEMASPSLSLASDGTSNSLYFTYRETS
jgi:hypothetical protein